MKEKYTQTTSQLPVHILPELSSDAPLMVDLPDGQKIVIGKLPAGTVIEIATWQGTGRPDSRTTRLMLGVANSETSSVAENEITSERSQVSKKNSATDTWLFRFIFPSLQNLIKVLSLFKRGRVSEVSNTTKKYPKLSRRQRSFETEPEISQAASEWLESIRLAASLEPKDRIAQKAARTKKTPVKQVKTRTAKPKAKKSTR